jgi:hypothetical protein
MGFLRTSGSCAASVVPIEINWLPFGIDKKTKIMVLTDARCPKKTIKKKRTCVSAEFRQSVLRQY